MTNSKSILTDIKKLLGIDEEITQFDTDIVVGINAAFMTLNQLGVGNEVTFAISDATATWADFFQDIADQEATKAYIYLKVRLFFDPPGNSFLIDSMERQINEIEWRLTVQVDRTKKA